MNTKHLMKTAALLLCQLLALQAHAGHEIGNGGGAWVCQNNDAHGTIRWAQLVDLYEGRTEFGLTIPSVANRDYLEIVDTVMVRRLFPVSDEFYRSINEELEAVRASLVPVDADLEVIDDALFRIRPARKECLNGTISYVQLANYTNYEKILVQKNLFEDPRLSETDKAALLIHEAVYAFLRKRHGDHDSVRARRIVGLLFSTLPQQELNRELEKTLNLGRSGEGSAFGMEFVRIRAGSFMMGSPAGENGRESDETQHRVQLAHDYEMQTTHVTQKQYFDVMGINPSRFKNIENCPTTFMMAQNLSDSVGLCPNNPVEMVSWADAQAFIGRLNALSRDGYYYRLPTEAEWEFAARAGSSSAYSFGHDAALLPRHGWFSGNSGGQTREVAQLRPNALGLYDMHGNAWQWVQDWYASDYGSSQTSPRIDPQGPSTGSYRVFRGGSWGSDVWSLRSAYRHHGMPDLRSYNDVGFRLVRIRTRM